MSIEDGTGPWREKPVKRGAPGCPRPRKAGVLMPDYAAC